MIRKLSILILPLAALASGCGETTTTTMDMAKAPTPDMAMAPPDMTILPDMAMPPAAPTVGAQIDRLGRPAINTAVTDPFDFEGMKGMRQDNYNKDGTAAGWPAAWGDRFTSGLAILDVLDGKCGNQALYNAMVGGVNFSAAGYSTFAGVLAGDLLLLNTATGTCKQYLAVELGAITGMPIADCGGRAPSYDVIDWSYGVLSGANVPVSDGVKSDGKPSDTTFPFLGDANAP